MNVSAMTILTPMCVLLLFVTGAFAATNVLEVFNNGFGVGGTNFNPTIDVGDTVHWVWASGSIAHSTTSAAGQMESWDSGIHTEPFTFDHTFSNAGTFNYYCTVHGFDAGGG